MNMTVYFLFQMILTQIFICKCLSAEYNFNESDNSNNILID